MESQHILCRYIIYTCVRSYTYVMLFMYVLKIRVGVVKIYHSQRLCTLHLVALLLNQILSFNCGLVQSELATGRQVTESAYIFCYKHLHFYILAI